mmetsp:Transcript_16591/g.52927  ORF Transcript_16591/g.52927 Transcript_16591/m.52927 type:complete len:230 (+) Transcript_16591:4714-5403(+)
MAQTQHLHHHLHLEPLQHIRHALRQALPRREEERLSHSQVRQVDVFRRHESHLSPERARRARPVHADDAGRVALADATQNLEERLRPVLRTAHHRRQRPALHDAGHVVHQHLVPTLQVQLLERHRDPLLEVVCIHASREELVHHGDVKCLDEALESMCVPVFHFLQRPLLVMKQGEHAVHPMLALQLSRSDFAVGSRGACSRHGFGHLGAPSLDISALFGCRTELDVAA